MTVKTAHGFDTIEEDFAYCAGDHAANDGKSVWDNPHDDVFHEALHAAWTLGYRQYKARVQQIRSDFLAERK